jgi:hypothetical protein
MECGPGVDQTTAPREPLEDRNQPDDLLLAKHVRWVLGTLTVASICAVTSHFDSQRLAAFCMLQRPLTVPTRDGLGVARKGADGSRSSTSSCLTLEVDSSGEACFAAFDDPLKGWPGAPLLLAGEKHLVEVASGVGAGDLDSAERLSAPRSRVLVLRIDGVVSLREPVEMVVGDLCVIGAVLAVVAVRESERARSFLRRYPPNLPASPIRFR